MAIGCGRDAESYLAVIKELLTWLIEPLAS